jgi:hypothetical protein
MTEQDKTLESLAVAFEVMGQETTETAVEFIANELYKHDFNAVQKAIKQACRECKYKITLADIISRIDDGRPSADEAWQEVYMLTEWDSKIMTDEQIMAFCSVSTALQTGTTTDQINCKKAFVDKYNKLVQEARAESRPVKYMLSMGSLSDGRVSAAIEAVAQGKMTQQAAVRLLPEYKDEILNIPLLPSQKEAAKLIYSLARGLT